MDSGLVSSCESALRTCKCISLGPMNLFTSRFLRSSWTSSLIVAAAGMGPHLGFVLKIVLITQGCFLLLDSIRTYSASYTALASDGLGVHTGDWEGDKVLGEGTQLGQVTLTDPHLFSISHWIVRRILNDNQLRPFLRQSVFWGDWCFLY